MSEINPYQPSSLEVQHDDGDEPKPPWGYRFVAGLSSAIGTVLLASGILGAFGASLSLLTGAGAGPQWLFLLGALALMVCGVGLIYAGILWYNRRAWAAIGWSVIAACCFMVVTIL